MKKDPQDFSNLLRHILVKLEFLILVLSIWTNLDHPTPAPAIEAEIRRIGADSAVVTRGKL
ncbi:hypothetical protein CH364_10990 [Leptospira harrisiae]|uniref:Uncharacterized protein n=1 Tax=Leptospira harrisiae TaxID=2023189 RepID=A0A2N0AJQ4_9LEPT|nr:hypothetical protein CH364_10990 [Leptospira harrisiae]